MSPRRRALLLALVALVAVAGVALALTARSTGPAAAAVRQDQLGPVLIVPGYGGSTASVAHLVSALRRAGHQVQVVELPGDGTGDLRDSARALDAAATAATQAGAPSVDVIGYSAGGVVARYWLKELGGTSRARRIVTMGSPHHGTRLAQLGSVFAAASCPIGCQQLVPDSDFMRDLNSGDETPDGPQYLSLWTSQDETVTPPDSARLEGAVDVVLQDVCPGIAVTHSSLPDVALTQNLIVRALATTPIPQPSSADCAGLSS